jgi:hypothetical protein
MRCYIFTLDDRGGTLNAQEIDCNSAEEALQLGSAAVADDPVEVWCGPAVLLVLSQTRPIPRLRKRLIIAERRICEGEQHIAKQAEMIAQLQRRRARSRTRVFRSGYPDRDPEGSFAGTGFAGRRSGKAVWIKRLAQSQVTIVLDRYGFRSLPTGKRRSRPCRRERSVEAVPQARTVVRPTGEDCRCRTRLDGNRHPPIARSSAARLK